MEIERDKKGAMAVQVGIGNQLEKSEHLELMRIQRFISDTDADRCFASGNLDESFSRQRYFETTMVQ